MDAPCPYRGQRLSLSDLITGGPASIAISGQWTLAFVLAVGAGFFALRGEHSGPKREMWQPRMYPPSPSVCPGLRSGWGGAALGSCHRGGGGGGEEGGGGGG